MLDIMRKKARTWGTKVIFGLIIVVFALFFGYNRISQRGKGARGGHVVATVNGSTITRPEYQLDYERTYKMYQQIFKGKENEPLPEGLEKSVQQTTINQLIQRKFVEKLGTSLGLTPTTLEITDAIKNLPEAKGPDGKFDPYLYKNRVLPYYNQKYNVDFEYLVSKDLLLQNVQDVFESAGKAPEAKDFYKMENTKWTFEVTEFESEESLKKDSGAKPKKVGPINISQRHQLFSADPGLAAYQSIFELTLKSQSLATPVHIGNKWYKVKLVGLEEAKKWEEEGKNFTDNLAKNNSREFIQASIEQLSKNAKVKNYLE